MGRRTACLEDFRTCHCRLTTMLPPRADVHATPPINAFERGERTNDTEVAGGLTIARLHNPRTHEQRDVDSHRFVVSEAGRTPGTLDRTNRSERS